MAFSAPLWAEINLDALAHNVRALKRLIGERVELAAVIKSNAYGHGAVPVAKAALESGASRLAVNQASEGVRLRQAGIQAPIILLGYALPEEAEAIGRYRLTPTVNSWELAQALSREAARLQEPISVHVKVDTGMGRFGLLPEEVVPFVKGLLSLPWLKLEGFWTHFACADEGDKNHTLRQLAVYREVLKRLEEEGITPPLKHTANSAATLDLPETRFDMVRCGIAIYGLYPSEEVSRPIPLQPVMSIKARVARVRTLPAGHCIGYGCEYITPRPMPVALIPIGYGAGYHRCLSNRGAVLIHGQRAPVLGRVSMDQIVVDVSGIPNVREGEEAVVLGRQGEGEIRADEIASWAQTIHYEVVTALAAHVPRVYLRGGEVVEVTGELTSPGSA